MNQNLFKIVSIFIALLVLFVPYIPNPYWNKFLMKIIFIFAIIIAFLVFAVAHLRHYRMTYSFQYLFDVLQYTEKWTRFTLLFGMMLFVYFIFLRSDFPELGTLTKEDNIYYFADRDSKSEMSQDEYYRLCKRQYQFFLLFVFLIYLDGQLFLLSKVPQEK